VKERSFYRSICTYICALGITTAIGFMLLALSLFLPQDKIHQHVVESTWYMQQEGLYPLVADRTQSSMLDNWSESMILMESDCMNLENRSYILTNPLFHYDGEYDPLNFLTQYVEDESPEPSEFYTRYWMGFRSIYRLLLTFFHHYQIKTYMSAGLLVLFSLVLAQICKNVDYGTAIAFAISMALVKFNIISVSIQYSCCFFIALLGMLLVPWISRNTKYEALFFAELGMITMYFDFYTTPIVTFGLPIIYLYMLNLSSGESFGMMRVVKNAVWWFCSYVGMWITKLLLTAMFTSAPSFDAAFSQAGMWLGVGGNKDSSYEYDSRKALKCVWESVVVDAAGAKIAIGLLIFLLLLIVYLVWNKKIDFQACRKNATLLLIVFLTIGWFCVAAQPTIIHSFFQYRSIAVAFWATGIYFIQMLKKRE